MYGYMIPKDKKSAREFLMELEKQELIQLLLIIQSNPSYSKEEKAYHNEVIRSVLNQKYDTVLGDFITNL